MTTELQRKIDGSIRLLQAIQKAHPNDTIEVAYSGGKDSDVILQLAKEAGINFRAMALLPSKRNSTEIITNKYTQQW